MKSGLKIAYFKHSKVSISETFIRDLICSLDNQNELKLYLGVKEKSKKIVKNQFFTGFFNPDSFKIRASFKLNSVLSVKNAMKKRQSQLARKASSKLKNIKFDADVAYIDYATIGVVLMDELFRRKIPFVVHVHGFDITSATNDTAYTIRLQNLFEKCSHFICASNYMKRLLVLLGCNVSKISVVHYGINPDVDVLDWNERLKRDPTICFLGRLTPKKHPTALVHAFNLVQKKLPSVKLKIIGDGPLMNDIKSLVSRLEIDKKVIFLGEMDRQNSFKHLRSSWVFAQHSVTSVVGDQEGYAISLAEAALHELPVVSTIHNGIPEHVISGETGFLVKEFDYEEMADRILELIRNPKLMRQFGKNGRKNIININQHEERLKKIEGILNRIIIKR